MTKLATVDTNILVKSAEITKEIHSAYKFSKIKQEFPCNIEFIVKRIEDLKDYKIVLLKEVLDETKSVILHKKNYLINYYSPFHAKFYKSSLSLSKETRERIRNDNFLNYGDALIYLSCIENKISRIITNNSRDFIRLNSEYPRIFKPIDVIYINNDLEFN